MALDSVARSRRRNTVIVAYIRLARPVQTRKAARHHLSRVMVRWLSKLRRFVGESGVITRFNL
jgi:hypothetical protein